MDKQKQRELFCEQFKARYPAIYGAYQSGERLAVETLEYAFGGWLLAKEHTEEMNKPVAWAKKRKDSNGIGLYGTRYPTAIAYGFKTFTEAELWAEKNGYRMVEPPR